MSTPYITQKPVHKRTGFSILHGGTPGTCNIQAPALRCKDVIREVYTFASYLP